MSAPDDSLEDVIRQAEERWHILDGLVRAFEDPHALLDVLVAADDVETARQGLQVAFDLSEIQATAALDVQFRRVARQELQKIVASRDEFAAQLVDLRSELP